MDGEDLYFLVNSLTRRQKRNFTEYYSRDIAKGSPLWYLIYERMLKLPAYEEKVIRGKEIEKQKSYTRLLNKLLEKLIESMTKEEADLGASLAFIRKSIDMGAISLAKRVLVDELKRLSAEEDLSRLLILLNLKNDLEYFHKFDLQTELGPDFPTRFEVMHSLKLIYELDQYAISLGQLMDSTYDFQLKVAQQMHADFDDFPTPTQKALAMKRRLLFRVALMENKGKVAYDLQEALVNSLEGSANDPSEWLNEMNIFLHVCVYRGQGASLADRLQQLEKMDFETPLTRLLAIRVQTLGFVNLARITLDVSFAENALSMISEHPRALEGGEKAEALYQLAWIYFAQGNWKKSLGLIREIEALDRVYRGEVKWQTELLFLVLQLERGEYDLVEIGMKRARRAAEKSELQFPGLVLQAVTIFNDPTKKDGWEGKMNELFENYAQVIGSKVTELMSLNYFDFASWMGAHLRKTTIAEFTKGGYQPLFFELYLSWLMYPIVYPGGRLYFNDEVSMETLEEKYQGVQERLNSTLKEFRQLEGRVGMLREMLGEEE